MKCFVYPFLAAILTLLGINLEAQSLSGRVLDAKTNEALTGANIIVKSNWRLGTSTDGNGEFTLAFESGLPTDTLLITYIGYEEQEVTYSGFKEQLSIRLQPSATNMNEVVVTAEKLIAEEFTYRKVERLDIYTNPSAKADPLLAVNTLPSSTTLDESANISFRGSSPTETGVFLNNVPIYDAVRFSQLNGIGTFSIFNTAIVENMQIFPGNPPLEYGNTTSGIIAIQTSEDIPEATTYSATLSLASVGVLTSRPINKNSGITAFTNYQPSAIIRGINHEALHKIKKFRSNDLGLNYTKKFRDQSLLKIFNYSLSESYDFQFDAPTYNGTFKQRKNRNLTVANWRKRSNQSEITVNGGVSFSVANFGYSDLNIKIYGRDVFLSANYQYTGELFDIKTGLTYDYRNQIFAGTFYQYDYAIGHGYPTQSESSATGLHRPEVYTYAKYYLGNRWIVGGGLRKNIPAKNQDNYISGQVNLLFQLNDNTSLNAAWGRYNKYNLPQNNNETAYLIKSDQYSLDLRYTNSPLS